MSPWWLLLIVPAAGLAFLIGLVLGEDSLPGNEGDVPPGWGRDEGDGV